LDNREEVFLMEFDEQGCDVCRQQWLSGSHPRELFTFAPGQVSFYQCDLCGAYWEETDRYAVQVDQERVQKFRELLEEKTR
jgi:hypothetical protein